MPDGPDDDPSDPDDPTVDDKVVNSGDYDTIDDAIAAVEEGGTLKLTAPVSATAETKVTKTMTVDLNGQTMTTMRLSASGAGVTLTVEDSTASGPTVDDSGNVTYSGGEVVTSASTGLAALNGASIVMNSGKVSNSSGVGADAYGNTDASSTDEVTSSITINGGYITASEFATMAEGRGGQLTINDGVFEASDNAVVGGNGTSSSTKYSGGTTMTINGGTFVGHIKSSGYIACGVYHPQAGVCTIDGAKFIIDGGIGILQRGGQMTVSNTTIKTTGTTTGKVGDSKVMQGCYGVCVDATAKYYDAANIACSLTNVNITSESAALATDPVDDETIAKLVVNSGTFSSDPTVYATGKTVTQDGDVWKVAA